MYPSGELKRLSDRKVLLQARIAVRRWEMAAAATEIARPLAMIDRGLQTWRRISPFVKVLGVSLGLFMPRLLARRVRSGSVGKGKLAALLGALPLIVRGIKVVQAARAAHAARQARA